MDEPTGSGAIGRQFHEHATWLRPAEVWRDVGAKYPGFPLTEPRVFWRPPRLGTDETFGQGRVGADMLGRFCRLVDSPDEAIVDFAKAFGTLQLCDAHRSRHVPASHDPRSRCAPRREREPSLDEPMIWSEPIEGWREWSGRARALLNIVASHHQGKLGSIEDARALEGYGKIEQMERVPGGEPGEHRFEMVDRFVPWRDDPGGLDPMMRERDEVAQIVEGWLRMGGARLGFHCAPDGSYRGSTTAAGLFGALGLQLLLVLTRADGFALCRGCSLPFAPSFDHRAYCESCGANTSARAAERKRRQRARDRGESGS